VVPAVAGTKKLSQVDFSNLKGINLTDGTASSDAASTNQVTNAQNFAISRANHTGTQLANTISNFDTQVRTSRLDQMSAPTASVAFNSQKITGLLDPTNPQEGATKNYVDTATAALTSGLAFKGSVRAATSTNITISSPGTTIDGLTAANGEIYILMGQTTASQNGPWVFNGSAVAMTRPTSWASGSTATLGSFWDVREGTNADTFVLLVTTGTITVDTTSTSFVVRGAAVPVNGYTTQCPAVTAGNPWTVTHNLNTKYVLAQVARVASPYDFVDARIERTSVNVVTVQPDVSLNAGDYEIMVYKVA
jgi:hypothetical protein